MIPDAQVEQFAILFEGRRDVHGTEQGGVFRRGPLGSMSSTQWWNETCREHLEGTIAPIGSYPMFPIMTDTNTADWYVAWGCIDFDEGEDESWIHARNVQNMLAAFNITAWVERSRSKGYHVWVFPSDRTPATLMRHALLAACQLVDAPTREINPKQETLGWSERHNDFQLGNYVRLPYPHQWAVNHRRCMIRHDGDHITLSVFLTAATASQTSQHDLARMAARYQPPAPTTVAVPSPAVVAHQPAECRLNGLAWTIYNDGPLNGSDRSETLWKLCREMAISNVTFGEAESMLREADRRWGKFHSRQDGAAVLHQMLTKAWT